MFRFRLLPILFFALVSTSLFAQRPDDHNVVMEALETRYPGYTDVVNKTFDDNLRTTLQKSNQLDDETLTIPVVIHVVWKEIEEDLPDDLIQSQIDQLNVIFSRQNADTIDLREEFLPVAGTANIQFDLIETIHQQTEEDFVVDIFGGGLVDEVKQTSSGGSDAWDTESFMNIWIVNVQGDGIFIPDDALLGYAYPPADLENWPPGSDAPAAGLEGVVIHFKAFGQDNPNVIENPQTGEPFDLEGKTVAHEVGHYLGLRHISGDGGYFENGCDVDDGMADTPNQASLSLSDCNALQNTCEEGELDMPDMIENYMDYSAESCQNTFTVDQVEFMRTVLETVRPGLLGTATSIGENARSVVNLAPNPTKKEVRLDMSGQRSPLLSITMLDALGNVIRDIPTRAKVIDLSEEQSGIYLLRFEFEDGLRTERVVKY